MPWRGQDTGTNHLFGQFEAIVIVILSIKHILRFPLAKATLFFRSIIGWIPLWLCLGCLRELQWDPSDRWTTCHSQRSSGDCIYLVTTWPYIQKAICNLHWYSWHGLAQFWVMIKSVPIKKVMRSALLPSLRHAMKITVQMRGPCSEPSWSGHPRKTKWWAFKRSQLGLSSSLQWRLRELLCMEGAGFSDCVQDFIALACLPIV